MKYKAEEPKRSSSGLGIRNSGFLPNPELQATGYCFFPMGPGIDFPMIMNYAGTDTGNGEPYFYFLNGHEDVTYFADQNFTEDLIETYEYTPFGILIGDLIKNNYSFESLYFENEIGFYQLFDSIYLQDKHYFLISNKSNLRNLKIFKELILKNFIARPPATGPSIACWVARNCPSGGIILLGCKAGPGCVCYCEQDENKKCIYTYLDCPFHLTITMKCY